MKMSRPAQKVENDIDFPVLGCSGELIRYNLRAHPAPWRGLWRPLPASLLHSTAASSPAQQPLQTPRRTLPPVLAVQLRVEGQVLGEQKRPWRAQLLALLCVSRHETTTHRPPAPDTYPSPPPPLPPGTTGIQSPGQRASTTLSMKQGMEVETPKRSPGYEARAAPQSLTPPGRGSPLGR